MAYLPDFLSSQQSARLISLVADTNKLGRADSVFLATLSAVTAIAASMLTTVGQRIRARIFVESYGEIVFNAGSRRIKLRSDGLLGIGFNGNTLLWFYSLIYKRAKPRRAP